MIGESRVQEAEKKVQEFKEHRHLVELHLIGHLQRNKVRKAITIFDVIQSVDSIRLAKKINDVSFEHKKQQHIFLQVNIGKDPHKTGFSPDEIIKQAQEISKMKSICCLGIMAIPPKNLQDVEIKSLYKQTRKIKDKIKQTSMPNCTNLSIGMSNDYTIALQEGATHIRIGRALFS